MPRAGSLATVGLRAPVMEPTYGRVIAVAVSRRYCRPLSPDCVACASFTDYEARSPLGGPAPLTPVQHACGMGIVGGHQSTERWAVTDPRLARPKFTIHPVRVE